MQVKLRSAQMFSQSAPEKAAQQAKVKAATAEVTEGCWNFRVVRGEESVRGEVVRVPNALKSKRQHKNTQNARTSYSTTKSALMIGAPVLSARSGGQTRGGREGADGARGHHRDRGAACGAWVGEGTPSSCSGKGTEAWLQFIGRSLTPLRTPLHHVHAKC